MASFILKVTTALVVLLSAVIYQVKLPRILMVSLGFGRTLEPLSSFPYSCRRIYHDHLKACEDMWLSESTRQLFLACSEPLARAKWMPNMGHLNVSGISADDAIVVIDIDDIKPGKAIAPRVLKTPGFPGTNGDGRIHLVGFTGVDDADGSIRLWIPNLKPSVDTATGALLDQHKFGANSTIELFRTGPRAEKLEHIRTFAHTQIGNPNRIAAVGGDSNSFYYTNDHGTAKVGLRQNLSPLLASGDVSFCDGSECRKVVSGLTFPNGLTMGQDGLIYVPDSLLGTVDIFQPRPNGDLTKIQTLHTGYSLDNITPDREGNMLVAAIPDAIKFFAANSDPLNKDTPTSALKIVKTADGVYEVTKFLEDGLGEILPGSTSVLRDAETGRVFLSSVFAPYIAVCDPK
ncbi:hypothetical protein F4778DRAFT_769028 [Xylariomycetidae sp. FL2044]|nr:hypothetical protein F4778DRAFT_769028 [Xylariomycetidae sp. FL2044]